MSVEADRVQVFMQSGRRGERRFMVKIDGNPCVLVPLNPNHLNPTVLQEFSNAQQFALPSDEQLSMMIDPTTRQS